MVRQMTEITKRPNVKLKQRIPRTVNIIDLKVTYSELFDDSYVAVPWDPSSYVTKIGDILIGFGEETYLRNALKKVEEKYGKEIKTVFIETKKIPHLSEPLIRRHGQAEYLKGFSYAGTWIIYRDVYFPKGQDPEVLVTTDTSLGHRDLVIEKLGRFLASAEYVKGVFGINQEGKGIILVTGGSGLSVQPYLNKLIAYFPGCSTATLVYKRDPVEVYKVASRKLRIKLFLPLTEKEKIYIEQFLPEETDWGDITGDEYTNKNRNEPELWRPIHQVTKPI
jgi:hypothetical protein